MLHSRIDHDGQIGAEFMNIERIIKIFTDFARRLPEPGMSDLGPDAGPQILTGPMVIRGNPWHL